MILPFGKFRGKRLKELPHWYLSWLDTQEWFRTRFPLLADAVTQRLDAMADDQTADEPQTTALATDVLKFWRRTTLAKWHPDKPGGSHAAFLAVSDAIESLGAMLDRGVRA